LDFCAGSEGVQFALSGTEVERSYQLFRDNLAVGAVLDGTGNAATFTDSFNEAGTYTARTVADELYCATAMDGVRVVVENLLPAIPDVTSEPRQCSGTVTLNASSPGAVIDWYADAAAATPLHTGASYTTPEIGTSTTYYVQARVENTGCLSARVPVLAEVITEGCCTAPGLTVNFTAFEPCSNSATGDYWYLIDTREEAYDNTQTYKVKLMADGRIWMVQDMKFGDKCDKKIFSGSTADQTGQVTSLTDKTYYGDCNNVRTTSTPTTRGYVYDWAAALNRSGAYLGSSSDVGCSGTGGSVNNCQGICPAGWHVPTGNTNGDYGRLVDAYKTCTPPSSSCWLQGSDWNSGYIGACTPSGVIQWETQPAMMFISSTKVNEKQIYVMRIIGNMVQSDWTWGDMLKSYGFAMRCVMNY
jgi:uncharacterized protein (TIGR02145 family)